MTLYNKNIYYAIILLLLFVGIAVYYCNISKNKNDLHVIKQHIQGIYISYGKTYPILSSSLPFNLSKDSIYFHIEHDITDTITILTSDYLNTPHRRNERRFFPSKHRTITNFTIYNTDGLVNLIKININNINYCVLDLMSLPEYFYNCIELSQISKSNDKNILSNFLPNQHYLGITVSACPPIDEVY